VSFHVKHVALDRRTTNGSPTVCLQHPADGPELANRSPAANEPMIDAILE
jgi:hypothetical protein